MPGLRCSLWLLKAVVRVGVGVVAGRYSGCRAGSRSLILDWADAKVSDAFTPQTLLTAGLLCIALHLAGIGTSTSWIGRRSR
jgi:hypothetical protein